MVETVEPMTTNSVVVAKFTSNNFKALSNETMKKTKYNAFCRNIQCVSTAGRTDFPVLRTVRDYIRIPGTTGLIQTLATDLPTTSAMIIFNPSYCHHANDPPDLYNMKNWLNFFSMFFAFRRGSTRVICKSTGNTEGVVYRENRGRVNFAIPANSPHFLNPIVVNHNITGRIS